MTRSKGRKKGECFLLPSCLRRPLTLVNTSHIPTSNLSLAGEETPVADSGLTWFNRLEPITVHHYFVIFDPSLDCVSLKRHGVGTWQFRPYTEREVVVIEHIEKREKWLRAPAHTIKGEGFRQMLSITYALPSLIFFPTFWLLGLG